MMVLKQPVVAKKVLRRLEVEKWILELVQSHWLNQGLVLQQLEGVQRMLAEKSFCHLWYRWVLLHQHQCLEQALGGLLLVA